MAEKFRNAAMVLACLGVIGLTAASGSARAQATDDFDASVTTGAATAIACGQDLSFGRVYVNGSNALATVTLSAAAAISSNHVSVVSVGGAIGQCTISGLQGGDTATVTIDGSGGIPVSGGLNGVLLFDADSDFLTATVQIGGGGTTVSGGRTGLTNGIIPVFGTVTIPAAHLDFGIYAGTLTATVALN